MTHLRSIAHSMVLSFGLAGLLLLLSVPDPAVAANPYHQLTSFREAMVSLKYVLDVNVPGMGKGNEVEGSATCLLIDAEGLVLCSYTEISGYVELMNLVSGRGSSFTVVPKKIEVTIGDSTEGLPANFLTRDRERDLAWMQIQNPPETKLPFLDFENSVALTVGQAFYRLRLLDRFFGEAPIIEEGVVGAVLDKPRRLYAPSTPSSMGFGSPVFTADGKMVGITVLQFPTSDDLASGLAADSNPFDTTKRLEDLASGLILPADDIVRATRLARELAAEEEDE